MHYIEYSKQEEEATLRSEKNKKQNKQNSLPRYPQETSPLASLAHIQQDGTEHETKLPTERGQMGRGRETKSGDQCGRNCTE